MHVRTLSSLNLAKNRAAIQGWHGLEDGGCKDDLIRTSTAYFRVVGTHALNTYEAAAGISFASVISSTCDIDLLWDTRKRVIFAQRLANDSPSMLADLQKVDKSFQVLDKQKCTAINQSSKPTLWNGCCASGCRIYHLINLG